MQEDVIAAHSPFSPRALDLSRPHASLPASACRGSLPTPPCRGSLPAWNYRSSLPVSACHSSLPNTASRRSRKARRPGYLRHRPVDPDTRRLGYLRRRRFKQGLVRAPDGDIRG